MRFQGGERNKWSGGETAAAPLSIGVVRRIRGVQNNVEVINQQLAKAVLHNPKSS